MRLITFTLLFAGFTLAFSLPDPVLIKGFVTDATGQRISGAAISVKGERNGVICDSLGNFSIVLNSIPATIEISLVGYETQIFEIKNKNSLWVILVPAKQQLQEVVVMGYSQKQNSALYGSTSSNIKIRGISSAPSTAPLQGRAAGVVVNSNRKNKSDDRIRDGYEREGYDYITENRYRKTTDHPLSTFSIDVDVAAYSNVRRFINSGELPPAGAVRIEEMINYFNYNYPQPVTEDPVAVFTETASSPWNKNHQLVMIGLQGRKIAVEQLPASNLVFLIDVSGSMNQEDKLPLVKSSLLLLVDQLRETDRVAIVVYAGAAGLVLPPTAGSEKNTIKKAIAQLEAGGSTAGSAGIQLAYRIARQNFVNKGNNRVILCTDGDFNVGVSSDDALERLIEKERESGVFLSVLGYGTGNYQDAKMQKLADRGNGNHAYIDQLSEAKKVLVAEFGGSLFTIAKDVKLQVEFNPNLVKSYRLIGYENRLLEKEDFNNDKKDAGDMGSGHTVTAIYEIIPKGVKSPQADSVDELKYQKPGKAAAESKGWSNELMTVKIRYKQPDGKISKLIEHPVLYKTNDWKKASENFRFAAAVAGYGMLLRHSEFRGDVSYRQVLRMAEGASAYDKEGYKAEFRQLIQKTLALNKDITDDEDDDDLTIVRPHQLQNGIK